jgi:hypothetical protein
MPNFPYVDQRTFMGRDDVLGPSLVNQAQANVAAIDEVQRVEHFADGQHNALEIPWVLGHMDDGATPTGYLFDTAYGGGTLARPATGRYTVSVVSGVISTSDAGDLQAAVMANVADTAIESKPHTITAEYVSATSMQLRVRGLSSALGAGNSWADVNRDIDVGIHALAQPMDDSLLATATTKQRRNFLTEAATDWSTLVKNQGRVRKAALLEHTSAGLHSVNRIAKGVVWARWTGAALAIDADEGVKQASCSRISQGVYEIVMDDNFTSTNTMACFPEVQPSTTSELVIINGRGFATGVGTSAFRFYIYAYSGGNWARADRSFFASMFGVTA